MIDYDHLSSTRHIYDQSAADYAAAVGPAVTSEVETLLELAMLSALALQVNESEGGRVADVGCGVGRATSYLADRDMDTVGLDLSPGMVAVARTAHPDLQFEVGSLTALPPEAESLAGAVPWYSIIHTPPTDLPDVWRQLAPVLAVPGNVLMAFQAGQNDEVMQSDNHRRAPQHTAATAEKISEFQPTHHLTDRTA